jgi:hypothetical protein
MERLRDIRNKKRKKVVKRLRKWRWKERGRGREKMEREREMKTEEK